MPPIAIAWRKPSAQPSHGFTLLELILVLVIVATMLSIVTPSLQRFHAGRRVEDAADHFMTVAQQARARAIDEATVYRLHVDLNAGAYWLTRERDEDRGRLMDELGRTFEWPSNINVTWIGGTRVDRQVGLTFHPDGRSQTVEVVFQGRENAVAVVRASVSEPLRMRPPTESLLVQE